jgi:hypothetical protein
MPNSTINGVRLFWEQRGEHGAPLLLVDGSWADHHSWDAVVPGLARTFRVFTYDRRGHSQSDRLPTQGSVEDDVADLAAFITVTVARCATANHDGRRTPSGERAPSRLRKVDKPACANLYKRLYKWRHHPPLF